MNATSVANGRSTTWSRQALWGLTAVAAFHAAYLNPKLGFLTVVYLFALVQLAQADKWRKAFYPGLAVGMLIAAGRLDFFWRIFSAGAFGLWLVFAFWIGLFVAVARLFLVRFKSPWNWMCVPVAWCGLEFFRSELYYLKFAWLTPGFAFAEGSWDWAFRILGVYGIGFALAAIASLAVWLWTRSALRGAIGLGAACAVMAAGSLTRSPSIAPTGQAVLRVSGVQMEFPSESEVAVRLKEVLRAQPETDLVVLSEYTFDGPVPQKFRDWCREHQKYLIAGGKEPAGGTDFFNTAYVISPEGEIVFRQVKSVPIQFFKDGLAATTQEVWASPWGKLGICICYDLSYTRVTDELVKKGAQAIIVPTMDVADWGERQHLLHGRVAPARAAEYGVPVFRLASSGISQAIDAHGRVLTQAPCPGQGAIIGSGLVLPEGSTLPLDRFLARASVLVTGLLLFVTLVPALRRFRSGPQPLEPHPQTAPFTKEGVTSSSRSSSPTLCSKP